VVRRLMLACVLAAAAVGALGATAAQSDPSPGRVKVNKAMDWSSKNRYLVRVALDGRKHPSDSRRGGKIDYLKAGDWIQIDCQVRARHPVTGKRTGRLYDKVNGYYVPDEFVRTFYTGRIPGAPASC
jgi:hypothetical protein